MSVIHLEMAGSAAAQRPPATEIAAEVTSMNRAFLDLLTDPLAPTGTAVLGLDPLLLDGLRVLSPAQRDELAAVPLLLADFSLPEQAQSTRFTYRVADIQLPGADAPSAWLTRVDAFANRLLTTLWHFSRIDRRSESGFAAFCMGFDTATARLLGDMSFAELSHQAAEVCASLRARHADHPSCWPDLIRLVAEGAAEQLNAARLGLIPLTVAMQQSAGAGPVAR